MDCNFKKTFKKATVHIDFSRYMDGSYCEMLVHTQHPRNLAVNNYES